MVTATQVAMQVGAQTAQRRVNAADAGWRAEATRLAHERRTAYTARYYGDLREFGSDSPVAFFAIATANERRDGETLVDWDRATGELRCQCCASVCEHMGAVCVLLQAVGVLPYTASAPTRAEDVATWTRAAGR